MSHSATKPAKRNSSKLPFERAESKPADGDEQSRELLVDRLTGELKQITALYNIGVALNSSLDPREIIWTLYKETGRFIDTSNFALVIYDENAKTLNFLLVFDQKQRLRPFSIAVSDDSALTGYLFSTEAPILVRDLRDSDKEFELSHFYPGKRIGSWLGVPIMNPVLTGESAQGAIIVWSYEPNVYTSHHVWLLSAIGTQASIAIRNARLFESSQRRAAEMARLKDGANQRAEEMAHLKDVAQRKADEMVFLNDVARSLSATLNLETVLTKIMEQVDDMLDVEAGSLLLTDVDSGDLVFQIALGDKGREVKPFRVPQGQGIAGRVALTGEPLVIADAGLDERHFKALDEKTQFRTRNMLCVPLILRNQSIGVLQVLNKKEGEFTQNDTDLLSSIASYAAIAIENARLYESLEAEHNRTIEAEQEARKTLARDLHDGPTQLVAAILMNLDFAKKALEKDPSLLPKSFDDMFELADRASHQMRTLLFELRPLVLETHGLGAALEVFLDRRQKDIGDDRKTALRLKIITDDPSGDISRRDGTVETTIFSIVQEVVNNAIKHAKADNIAVELKETPDGIYTEITDDGVGFDVVQVLRDYETRGSLGMINLRERTESIGGEFSMTSQIGEGTRTRLFVPNEKAEKDKRKKKRVTGMLKLPTDTAPVKSRLQ
jgi:signal transduction histidine kinase